MSDRTLSRRGGVVSQDGAVIVHVLVAIVVLTGFLMFVADYGLLWVGRTYAQNSADSGALAGAMALAYDDFADRTDDGPAKQAALAFARVNVVIGQSPDVDLDDVKFYSEAPALFPAECADDSCVRVDVYRNQARGNALPTIFGWMVGLTGQGVRATATAQAVFANASDCLKPWGIADKWDENNPIHDAPWAPGESFDPTGPDPDVYIPPTSGDPGTSFTLANDLGTELVLKTGNPHDAINPGWFQPLDLSKGGGSEYSDNIPGCVEKTWAIGDDIPKENGNMIGPTKHGVEDLIALDPDADWNGTRVVNSCVGPPYTCSNGGYTQSPRIVALPVFDLQHYMDTGGPGNGTVHIVNILGFFVDRMDGNDVVGYLATKPDLKLKGGGSIAPTASFIRAVQLVR